MDTTILLITPDLLAASRLAGLAAAAGARIEQRSAIMHDADLPACDLVLLDLQGQGGDLAPVVAAARAALVQEPAERPGRVVAFGPHVAGDRLRAAVAAGCDEAVSRGELLGGFASLLRRWLG
ncbi:MAG: hypothetical protein ACK5SI_18215 [Planctomycetia bacterium]|jgi:hypothetical protein